MMRKATPEDLEAVRSAVGDFRARWKAIRPPWPCPFEGTADDLDALDYLDYEGLAYPPSGIAGAALVWGNVIARQLPFEWRFDEEIGGLVLWSAPGVLIWPFGRVYESQSGLETQFDKYRWLAEWAVLMSLRFSPSPEERARMEDLIVGREDSGLFDHLTHCMGRLGELRGRPA